MLRVRFAPWADPEIEGDKDAEDRLPTCGEAGGQLQQDRSK